jgi:Tfp pilus assembly protein PilF
MARWLHAIAILCVLVLTAAGSRGEGPQHTVQRRSAESVRTAPGDSSVQYLPPEWEYSTPEDAEILQGWQVAPAEGAAGRAAAGTYVLSDMARGWQLYAKKRYAEAARHFSAALDSKDAKESRSARLGLAYALIRLGRPQEAIGYLETLVAQGYHLSETRPALIGVLLRAGRWEEAQMHIARLPPRERALWQKRLLEARLLEDTRRLPPEAGPQALSALLDRHAAARAGCIRPDVFHAIAMRLRAEDRPAEHRALEQGLLDCELPPELRFAIVSALTDTLPADEALALLVREKPVLRRGDPGRIADFDALALQLQKRRLAALPADSEAKAQAAQSILALSPQDRDALEALAWYYTQRKDSAQAERYFSRLHELEPANKDYALALGYARLETGATDTALAPLEEAGIPEDEDTRRLRALVLRRQAAEAYEAKNWDRAADRLERLLALEPDDSDARELLGWTRYRQERRAEAEPLLEERFAERPGPGLAEGLLGLYSAAGDEDRVYAFADRLAGDADPAIRRTAAEFFFDHGAPITASQLDRDPDRCYTNADSLRAEAFLYNRYREGDSGFSKLLETAMPLTLVYPAELGEAWSASLTPKYLSSGSAPDRPKAGRYFRAVNGTPQRRDLEDSLFVVQPDLGFEWEGRLHTTLHAGTTPLGGPVDPTPTLEVRLDALQGYLDLHRCNVKDSILSYVGQKDPYSGDEWGRVTRNGIEAGLSWPLEDKWWLSTSGGFDAYMGQHVWDNQAVHFDAAAGRTHLIDSDEFSYGLFFTAQHFRRNSDFFTYGHGGYYSPELMTMVGPFVRYRTAVCRTYWFDIQSSVGWLHQQLDASPFYPLSGGGGAGLSPAAAAELDKEYDSDTDEKIGFSVRLQGMKLLSQNVAVGGFAALDNTSDHTEYVIGAGLQFFFDPQNLFWTRKDMFGEFGKCSNK